MMLLLLQMFERDDFYFGLQFYIRKINFLVRLLPLMDGRSVSISLNMWKLPGEIILEVLYFPLFPRNLSIGPIEIQ